MLEFNPEKIEQVEAEFSGKKTQRYRYTVTDPNNDNKQEKCLEVGKRTSEDIDGYLREGHTLLKIQRFGLGRIQVPRYTFLAETFSPYFFKLKNLVP